jgi:hypothetical protein
METETKLKMNIFGPSGPEKLVLLLG